jgi:hypothetical protein
MVKPGASLLRGWSARNVALLVLVLCLSLTLFGCSTPIPPRPDLPADPPSEVIITLDVDEQPMALDLRNWLHADGLTTMADIDVIAIFSNRAQWIAFAKALIEAGRFK